LKTVKIVEIFKKKYSEYLLLQQKHNQYILIYHIRHVVCVVWMQVTRYIYNLLTFVLLCLFSFFEIGDVVVVIVWEFDLQLPIKSVPITANVVSSNPA
jgi:hypothetical protein